MSYKVVLSSKAERDLSKIDKYQAKMIVSWIAKNLDGCENPRAIGKPLVANLRGYWRYETGSYRIICEIQDAKLTIAAIKIGHRREVYG